MTGRRKVTDILAVTPQSSRPARDQAMTSSRIVHRIPPWMTPSQPSNRRSSSTSVQERSGSTWMVRPSPWALRVPQAKQLCGAISKRGMPGTSMTRGSDVKVLYLAGLGLDELLARRDLLAHEHREDLVRARGVVSIDAEKRPRLRVHRRLPELVGIHLAETLEALDREVLDVELLDDPIALLFGLRVARLLAGADPVQRRLRDVEVAVLDHLGHVPVEEGEEERPDVSPIHIRVGHDDDPVISQLRGVEALPDPGSERDDQRSHVLAREDLVEARLLDVEQLAAQRQHRLEPPIPPLLGRTARRVPFDDVQLAPSRVTLLAVGELSRQREAIERSLADHEIASLAGRLAGSRGREALLDDAATVGGVLVEVLAEAVRDGGLDLALHLSVPELGLGLTLELRIGQLHADDGRQAFANVIAGQVAVAVLEDAGSARPVVERARQGSPEARDVGAPIHGIDVVGEGEDVFGVRVVVLERDLDGVRAFAAFDVDRPVVDDFLLAVQVPHERLESALEVERPLAVSSLIAEGDPDTFGEIRRFAEPLADGFVIELRRLEHLRVGPEARGRPFACSLGPDLLHRCQGLAALVLLRPDVTIAC